MDKRIEIPDYIECVDMLKPWLKNRQYEGLYRESCMCDLDELCACREGWGGCIPGYKIDDPEADMDYRIIDLENFKEEYSIAKFELNKYKQALHDMAIKYACELGRNFCIYCLRCPQHAKACEFEPTDEKCIDYLTAVFLDDN